MFELIKSNKKYNFAALFPVASVLSLIVVAVSLFFIVDRMNYGVDFRGGAEVQVKFGSSVNLQSLRQALKKDGFKSVTAQSIGQASDNEYLVKVAATEENLNSVTQKWFVNSVTQKWFLNSLTPKLKVGTL